MYGHTVYSVGCILAKQYHSVMLDPSALYTSASYTAERFQHSNKLNYQELYFASLAFFCEVAQLVVNHINTTTLKLKSFRIRNRRGGNEESGGMLT